MKSKFVSGAIVVIVLIVTLALVAFATPQAIEPIDFNEATNPSSDTVASNEPTDGIGNTIATVPSNPSAENTPPEPNNNNGFGIVIPPAMNENVPDVIVPSNPPVEKVPTKPAADTEASTQHENDDEVGSINMYPVKDESLKDVVFVATPDETVPSVSIDGGDEMVTIPSEPEADVSAPPKDEEDDIVTSPIPTEPESDEEDKNLPVATPDEPTNALVQFADDGVCHIISASDITLDNGTSCVLFLYADNRYHNLVIENDEWYFCGQPQSAPASEVVLEVKPVDLAVWELSHGHYYVLYNNGDYGILTVEP